MRQLGATSNASARRSQETADV